MSFLAKNKPKIEELLVNQAIEEQGFQGLLEVIEMKDPQIAEQDEQIETLAIEKNDLKREVSKLNVTIDKNLVIAQENAAVMQTDLLDAEQVIRQLELGTKLKSYVRFSERTEKLEIEEEVQKSEEIKEQEEAESDDNSEQERSESEESESEADNFEEQILQAEEGV